jgi:ABC-type multidrug transport system ATPase subunit
VRTYSRGQRQRLALAVALSRPHAFALLDEPFTALDEPGCAALKRYVDRTRATRGYLLTGHRYVVGDSLVDRAFVLQAGRLQEITGTSMEISGADASPSPWRSA